MALVERAFHTVGMNQPSLACSPERLHVLIVTEFAETGAAIASLLEDDDLISTCTRDCVVQVMRGSGDCAINVVLLDVEPWPNGLSEFVFDARRGSAAPLLLLAVIHGPDERMRKLFSAAGIDHLFDRAGDFKDLLAVLEARRTTSLDHGR